MLALAGVLLAACVTPPPDTAATGPVTAQPSPTMVPPASPQTRTEAAEEPVVVTRPRPRRASTGAAVQPPAWLGTRVLPRRPDGWGVPQPTPRILRNRRFVTRDLLPPPPSNRFQARVTAVPRRVARRSTWNPRCPVPLEELRYLRMSFWGFDDRPHTGEMIVNAGVADDIVRVFRRLYRARFPIEQMRVRRAGEIDAPPTGDYNNTDGFDCRPATGGDHWSQHAFGLAIDINPFHNPYRKGDLVVPELAEAYLDRSWRRPGMIHRGDVVTRAFADIGWGWGGDWQTLDDWQHFSSNGR